jgi:hypothetical protein
MEFGTLLQTRKVRMTSIEPPPLCRTLSLSVSHLADQQIPILIIITYISVKKNIQTLMVCSLIRKFEICTSNWTLLYCSYLGHVGNPVISDLINRRRCIKMLRVTLFLFLSTLGNVSAIGMLYPRFSETRTILSLDWVSMYNTKLGMIGCCILLFFICF